MDTETMSRLTAALDELQVAIAENEARNRAILIRIEFVRSELEGGARLADLVSQKAGDGLVELIAGNVETLHTTGAMFRVIHAQSLRAEGLSIAEIAEHYGLTRQRVSALLKQEGASD